MPLPKENLPLDGVNFLKVSPGILKIRPSRSDFQSRGLITLPYSMCALNDHLSHIIAHPVFQMAGMNHRRLGVHRFPGIGLFFVIFHGLTSVIVYAAVGL